MRRRWIIALLLLAAGLAGCIASDETDADPASTSGDLGEILPSDESLFENPQTAPHPDYDNPTLTTIPEDAGLPEYWQPIEPAAFDIENIALEPIGEDPDGVAEYGSGIAIFGELVIVPGRSTGSSWAFDISDPTSPQLVSEFPAPGRDVDTLAFPDGRLYAVFATDSGIVPIWNLTNPKNPSHVGDLEPERGSHNVGIVPGTPLLYNSAGAGGGDTGRLGEGTQGTAIYDLSTPEEPELVQDFDNGYSCHDISFSIRLAQEEYRAYCAGYDVSQIWDIADPENPEVIVDIPVHHGISELPAISQTPQRFAHLAMASNDGDVLIVGDETGGGGQPACDVHSSQGPQTLSGPVGNLYFYDVSDETNPQLLSMISPDSTALMTDEIQDDPERATGSCTAHFGRMLPHEDKDMLAIGFYARGVNMIDFTNPSNPTIVDQFNEGTNTWDVWFYQGYLFTGDTQRGMDVFALNGS